MSNSDADSIYCHLDSPSEYSYYSYPTTSDDSDSSSEEIIGNKVTGIVHEADSDGNITVIKDVKMIKKRKIKKKKRVRKKKKKLDVPNMKSVRRARHVTKTAIKNLDRFAKRNPQKYTSILHGRFGERTNEVLYSYATRGRCKLRLYDTHIEQYVRKRMNKDITISFASKEIRKIFLKYFKKRYPHYKVVYLTKANEHYIKISWEEPKRKCCACFYRF